MTYKGPKIGSLQLDNPFLLAPLAGITDKTMRSLCSEAGASLTYTEMVSAKGLWYGDKNTRKLLEIGGGEGPVGFQLFGSEPEIMERAVQSIALGKWMKRGEFVSEPEIPGADGEHQAAGGIMARPALIDLNAGCPVPKIVKNGEGSALLKDLDRLHDVAKAMVRGAKAAGDCADQAGADQVTAPLPITAKIRIGFLRGENIAVEAAKALEAAGVSAVAVHGRTREQYYEGKADWKAIAQVKKAVKIPVIGNGDVYTGSDALRMLDETGSDGVMIARGALGNPWIFAEARAFALKEQPFAKGASTFVLPTQNQRIEMLIRHLDMVIADKGERVAVKEMRKHIAWYTKGMHGATAIRRAVNAIDDAESMKREIRRLLV